jgi:hypothetical protein
LFTADGVTYEDALALAHQLETAGLARQSALVVLATGPRVPRPCARAKPAALELELLPINVLQARALLASMFGAGSGLESLAVTLHALSRGNIRALTELARALVARGLLRCDAGTWLFPERLDDTELASLAQLALGAELEHLSRASSSVQAAAYALALDPQRALSYASLLEIIPELSRLPVSALSVQLAPLGVVLESSERSGAPRLRIADEAWARVLAAAVPADAARGMHLRLAEVAERSSYFTRAFGHRCKARDFDAAIRLLIGYATPFLSGSAAMQEGGQPPHDLPLAVAQCGAAARRAGCSPREQVLIDCVLVFVDPGAEYVQKDVLREVGKRLGRESGLDDFAALDASIPQPQRAVRALEIAKARHASSAAEGHASVAFAPAEALRLLVRIAHSASTIAVATADPEFLRILPSLAPYAGLATPIAIVDAVMNASAAVIVGHYLSAREQYLRIVRLIDAETSDGVDGSGNRYTRLAVIHGIGFIEGQLGMRSALERVAALHDDAHLAVSAWHLQGTYHFMQGDTEQANACRERAELLNASRGAVAHFPGASVVAELLACSLADDLIGLKRAADRVATLAARYPGWRTMLLAAQIEYARVRGDLAAALELLRGVPLDALREVPGSEVLSLAAARTLLASDRLDEAHALANRLNDHAAKHGMQALPISITLALIEARRGELPRAIERADATLRTAEALGTKGLPLGRAHELRATLAILAGDAEQLAASARACADEYARGHNPALHALYQGLLARARRAGFPIDRALSVAHNDARATPEAVEAELDQSACEHELAERALSHVIARSGARDGFLYLRDLSASAGIRRVAARGAASAAIDAHAAHVLANDVDDVTVSVDDGHTRAALGPEHETFVLGRDDIAPIAVGVIVLVDSHRHGAPATLELLPALTRSCARWPLHNACKHAKHIGIA